MLDAAGDPAADLRRAIHRGADLAPDVRCRRKHRVHRQLIAVAIDARDVVRARRREDFLEAVAVHVGDDNVLIPQSRAAPRIACVTHGPSGAHRPVWLEDIQLK